MTFHLSFSSRRRFSFNLQSHNHMKQKIFLVYTSDNDDGADDFLVVLRECWNIVEEWMTRISKKIENLHNRVEWNYFFFVIRWRKIDIFLLRLMVFWCFVYLKTTEVRHFFTRMNDNFKNSFWLSRVDNTSRFFCGFSG